MICTTLQVDMYGVINDFAHMKIPWHIEVVVNTHADIPSVSIVGLIPNNVVRYVKESA